MTDNLLTVAAACEKLAVSRSALYRLISAEHITPIKIGRSTRFAASDLDAFIASMQEVA